MEPIPLPNNAHSWLVARHPDGHWENLAELLPPLLARLEAEGVGSVHTDSPETVGTDAAAELAALDIRSAERWGRSSEGSHAYFVEVDSYWLGP